MEQNCWQVWPDRGLLIAPDPIVRLRDVVGADFPVPLPQLEAVEQIAADLPDLLENRKIRQTLRDLPVVDFSALKQNPLGDFRIIERLQQIYAYFASAYIYATHEQPIQHIPQGVAVPLVLLSELVERPPILAYSNYVLNNWRKIDPAGEIALGNLELNQNFLGNPDEIWFILVHVDIEARAAETLAGLQTAAQGAHAGDDKRVGEGLTAISSGLDRMIRSFARMPEGCNPDVYYFRVRPYIFGFNDIVYEGVFDNVPQNYRGQTGAQSSIIPALVAGLGIEHEKSSLMEHLRIMQDYMPKPHREFMAEMGTAPIRPLVIQYAELHGVYNACIEKMIAFRKLHYHFATEYIFKKVDNPLGTGGTVFMDWLHRLIGETEQHQV
jgi:indoleamine 2,3-dioxygenase